jgi:hypothetical protein
MTVSQNQTPAEVRRQLLGAGFSPLPLKGKAPVIAAGQKLCDPTDQEIELLSRTRPAATNTGILTRLAPTLDIDIREEAAAVAVEDLARERFEERGYVLVRIGRAPKRCIPFRTLTPFPKIVVDLIAPGGAGEKLELLADGQQVVHGVHPDTGKAYSWFGGAPGEIKYDDLPYISAEEAKALIDDASSLLVKRFDYRHKSADKPAKATGNGADGETGPADWSFTRDDLIDHDRLAALAMRLVKSGLNAGAAVNFLRSAIAGLAGVDEERRARRLKEIPGMVESAQEKLDQADRPVGPPSTLEETLQTFDKWLALESHTSVLAALGAVAANHLDGDPVWLGVVAPPSSAKTEIINSLSLLPHVLQAATLTPAALQSGTPRRDRDKTAKGGLLRTIGDFGVLALKDFGSILSMRQDAKAELLAALREIADGAWTRHVGVDGGKTLAWKGKLGLVFGVTPAIDAYHSVIGSLGDRWLLTRMEPVKDQFAKALEHRGAGTKAMRAELAQSVARLFAGRAPGQGRSARTKSSESGASSLSSCDCAARSSATAEPANSTRSTASRASPESGFRSNACLRGSTRSASSARGGSKWSSASLWTQSRRSGARHTSVCRARGKRAQKPPMSPSRLACPRSPRAACSKTSPPTA